LELGACHLLVDFSTRYRAYAAEKFILRQCRKAIAKAREILLQGAERL